MRSRSRKRSSRRKPDLLPESIGKARRFRLRAFVVSGSRVCQRNASKCAVRSARCSDSQGLMKGCVKSFLAFVLATVLVVTSQAGAIARAQPSAVGQVDICAGMVLVRVHVDADGKPVLDPRLCSDAVQALFSVTADPPPTFEIAEFRHGAFGVVGRAVIIGSGCQAAQSRGPPAV